MKKLFTFIVALMATVAVNAANQTKGPKITAPTELAGWYVGFYCYSETEDNTYSGMKKEVDKFYESDHLAGAEWTDDYQSALESSISWQQPLDGRPYGTIANDGTFYGGTKANEAYMAYFFVDNAKLVKGAHWKIYLAPKIGECTLTNADLYLQGTFGTGLITEPITVNKCGNASYVTTSALDFTSATVKAYVATNNPDASATFVTLTRVKQVPAGTPIFVFTDEALTDAKSYKVTVGSSTTLTDWTTGETVTSVLEGSTTATKTVNTANETVYALKSADGKLHKCNDGVVIPAKKAYISVAQYHAKESLDFNFGEATAINNVNADADVNQAREGKYIENGKIVIVKNGKKYNAAGQLMK